MHEASLVAELLEIVKSQAAAHEMTRVTGLRLRVGALRMAVPQLLQSAFEVMRAGTIAGGATLTIELVPLIARCPKCAKEIAVEDFVFLCANCGSATEVRSGKELDLVEMTGEGGDGR